MGDAPKLRSRVDNRVAFRREAKRRVTGSRLSSLCCIRVMLLSGSAFVELPDRPGASWLVRWGAYFDAHFACSCLAWNTPSRPKLPSARACDSSLKVSGGASVPL